mmetsp:Transcript_26186/g.36689  ORF Transcript_26186/g.36689 Transcript_26186/m.36689 type:complete len:308 (-) Transcript_26186:743-1666(-)
MAQTNPMASPTTFSFGWSSDQNSNGANKSPKAKPLANPLLDASSPSPMQGQGEGIQRLHNALVPLDPNVEGLRQRKSSSNGMSNGSRMAPPPNVSLSMQGTFVGATKKEQAGVGNGNGIHREDSGGPRVSWGRMDSPPPNSGFGTSSNFGSSLDESFDRWVLVYGYATRSQYEAILKLFENFGKVTSRKGTCNPGQSNWLAMQYETSLQAEKALCQQHCMLEDGVLVGVTRMDPTLKQSLDWNVAPGPLKEEDVLGNRLEERFHQSQNGSYGMKEQDVLLECPRGMEVSRGGKKNVCEQVLSWVFDW